MPSEIGCLKEQAFLTSFPRGYRDTSLTQGTLSEGAQQTVSPQLTRLAVPGEASTLQALHHQTQHMQFLYRKDKNSSSEGEHKRPGALQVTSRTLAHHEH